MNIHRLRGLITSVAFDSGNRFVVGNWHDGPLGPMNDVMWADPTGKRTLLAPSVAVANFVTAIYTFEEVIIEPIEFNATNSKAVLQSPSVSIEYSLGRTFPIPLGRLRSLGFTRRVEGPIARKILGVHTYGTSNTGVREWYCADSYRRVDAANGELRGSHLGQMCNIDMPLKVGFSEPPMRPSMVAVRPALHDPSGNLDRVLLGS